MNSKEIETQPQIKPDTRDSGFWVSPASHDIHGKDHNLTSKRPYSYPRYWTGTSLQLRLMRGVFKCKWHSSLFYDIPPQEPPFQVSSSPIPTVRIWSIRFHYQPLFGTGARTPLSLFSFRGGTWTRKTRREGATEIECNLLQVFGLSLSLIPCFVSQSDTRILRAIGLWKQFCNQL